MTIIKTEQELKNFAKELLKYKKGKLGFDTEGTGLKAYKEKVLLIQFGDQYKQWVIDVYKVINSSMNPKIFTDLFKLINDLGITLVAHNFTYDFGMIKTNFNVEIVKGFCTYLGSMLLTMGLKDIKQSLEYNCERFLSIKLDKTQQSSFIGLEYGTNFTDEQLTYAGHDVKYLLPLEKEITKHLKATGQLELAELEFQTAKVTAAMEIRGIQVNAKKWKKAEQVAERDAADARKELDNIVFTSIHVERDIFGNADINYNSPVQLKGILSQILKTKLESTSERTLKNISHPVITALFKYRKAMKLVTTYGSAFLKEFMDPNDYRIRSNFRQLGPGTGRYASDNPKLNWGLIW